MQVAISTSGRRTATPHLSTGTQILSDKYKRSGTANQSVEKILKSFNTWSFKREQPSDLELLGRFVANRVRQSLPISFVLYWGKGPRNHIANPDNQCLEYLTSFRERIAEQYSAGAELTLCLTDTHARHNGHADNNIRSYYEEVSSMARRQGFKITFLSDLVSKHQAANVPEEVLETCILDDLKRCAAKWYRGDGGIEQGAREYFAMNMTERRAVERSFPESVFITFNGSSYRSIFPAELPVFYMYSLKKGSGVKPWFLDGYGHPYNDPDCLASSDG